MGEEETVATAIRVDTAGFAREVASLRDSLESGLSTGADRAGRAIETSLLRAVRTGKLGLEDLRTTALSVLGAVATSALKGGVASLLGEAGGGGGSLLSALAGVIGGLPGRATGGPVAPGRAYLVGERGPELFVPTASGRVEAGGATAATGRDVRVAISINAPANAAPAALAQSSRQLARAVRAALAEE